MHKFVAVVTPHVDRVMRIIDNKCESRDWDWAVPGGRYANLIPVSKRCQPIRGMLTIGADGMENGFPWRDIPNNDVLKYVSGARIRNINVGECARLKQLGKLTIFEPYSVIIDEEEYDEEEFCLVDEDCDEAVHHRMAYSNYIHRPDRQHWYVVIVDVHW